MTKLSTFLKEPKKISSAVYFTNGKQVLIVKPTGWIRWELPKGTIDEGETPKNAAIREFREEVGIRLKPGNLKFIRKFNLHKQKDIMLFLYKVNKLPPINSMKCTSMFTNKKGMELPEINKWRYINIKDINLYLRRDMVKMVKEIM